MTRRLRMAGPRVAHLVLDLGDPEVVPQGDALLDPVVEGVLRGKRDTSGDRRSGNVIQAFGVNRACLIPATSSAFLSVSHFSSCSHVPPMYVRLLRHDRQPLMTHTE
jgi:hypothetical protein